jgi:hypothetical protein
MHLQRVLLARLHALCGLEAQCLHVLQWCSVMQLPPGDASDQVAEKRRTMLLREVDSLALSFQSLVKIDNLTGATALRKLKLDCNRITRIENLDHLVCTILWQMHCICAVYIRLLCSGRSFLCHFFA